MEEFIKIKINQYLLVSEIHLGEIRVMDCVLFYKLFGYGDGWHDDKSMF